MTIANQKTFLWQFLSWLVVQVYLCQQIVAFYKYYTFDKTSNEHIFTFEQLFKNLYTFERIFEHLTHNGLLSCKAKIIF